MGKRGALLGAVALTGIFALIACVGDEPASSSGSDAGGGDGGGSDGATGGDASPTCTPPLVLCGSACVDPATFDGDGKNCGACAHDCLGGGCSGGTCGSVAVLAAAGTDAGASSISSIGYDGTHVLYLAPKHPTGVGEGIIYACDLPTCGTPTLVFDGNGFGSREIDEIAGSMTVPGVAYYTSNNNDGIYRVVTDGGDPAVSQTQCATADPSCEFLGVSSMLTLIVDDGAGLVFGNSANGNSYYAQLPNGTGLTQFGGNISNLPATSLATDPSESPRHWLYAIVNAETTSSKVAAFDITATNLGTAMPSVLVSANPGDATTQETGGLALLNGNVYYTQNDGTVRSLSTCAATCPTNPIPTTFATVAGSNVMIATKDKIVWAAGSSIYACPPTGCASSTPSPVASTPHLITALGQDAVSIFWGDELGGIYRLAK